MTHCVYCAVRAGSLDVNSSYEIHIRALNKCVFNVAESRVFTILPQNVLHAPVNIIRPSYNRNTIDIQSIVQNGMAKTLDFTVDLNNISIGFGHNIYAINCKSIVSLL